MIKRIFRLAAFLMLSLLFNTSFAGDRSVPGSDATVTALDGTAKVFGKENPAGRALKKGDRLGKDQEVRVGERSRIELRFPDGTVMRLSERSRLSMSEVLFSAKTERKNVKVNLGVGKLWANVKKLMTADSSIEVKTTNAVAGVRGTIYRVNVDDDKTAVVKVYDGSVYVANPPRDDSPNAGKTAPPHEVAGPQEVAPPYHEVSLEEWTAIVKAMQQITISPQGVPSKPESFDPKADADEWVRWNQERDKKAHF
jgi:hypothetical protein